MLSSAEQWRVVPMRAQSVLNGCPMDVQWISLGDANSWRELELVSFLKLAIPCASPDNNAWKPAPVLVFFLLLGFDMNFKCPQIVTK